LHFLRQRKVEAHGLGGSNAARWHLPGNDRHTGNRGL